VIRLSPFQVLATISYYVILIVALAVRQEQWLRTRPRYHWWFALLAGLAWGVLPVIVIGLWVGTSPNYPAEAFYAGILALFTWPFYAGVWFVLVCLLAETMPPGGRLWCYRIFLPIMLSLPILLIFTWLRPVVSSAGP